jgi:hypothetical protein
MNVVFYDVDLRCHIFLPFKTKFEYSKTSTEHSKITGISYLKILLLMQPQLHGNLFGIAAFNENFQVLSRKFHAVSTPQYAIRTLYLNTLKSKHTKLAQSLQPGHYTKIRTAS